MGISIEVAKGLWKRGAVAAVELVPAALGKGYQVILTHQSGFSSWTVGQPCRAKKMSLSESLNASGLVFDTEEEALRIADEIKASKQESRVGS